ncbi:hypothetical protein [Ornithinimicrobium cerasi]|uniref:hypothetical protein n=1 Tax=Ornithinimicrobium cerasi TaxID=2248773 RepID=UPI000F00AF2C|nr:hypothetical protein [Ornithinimicrobium cerasi]
MRFPFITRARAERAFDRARDAVAAADDKLQRQEKTLGNVRGLVREMHEQHKPYPGQWADIGNGGSGSEWWCTSCRTHWPCKPWRELRRLYLATYGPDKPEPLPEMEITVRPKRVPNIPLVA